MIGVCFPGIPLSATYRILKVTVVEGVPKEEVDIRKH